MKIQPARLWLAASLLALALPQVGSTQSPSTPTSKIHALAELSDDANLAKWIAETIPEVIKPETWKKAGGPGVVSYYAPTRTLVVYQSPEVQTEVDAFLLNLRKSIPQEKAVRQEPRLLQAQFTVPTDPAKAASGKSTAYPIPTAQQQPKHLFHLVFRYEGEGGLETAMSSLVSSLNGTNKDDEKPVNDDSPEKAKSESSSNLLHFIIRYEGEGLIDASVVEFLKQYAKLEGSESAKAITNPGPAIRPISAEEGVRDVPLAIDNLPPPPLTTLPRSVVDSASRRVLDSPVVEELTVQPRRVKSTK